ncbi:E3 ubiquitin- ligase RNF213 [Paramuricea clavata]|uniref:E3 ubiquitin- ligase RNF213 n=1 Tax=Paramuricea clavata TaxID=317549 RepID=A0A6S7LU25_PARCT|nr:E3 ubiquitin- ligase RNF213 [Paramuricea clavata]
MQRGIRNHESAKNNQTEQVQGRNGCPKPEKNISRTISDVTSGRYNPSPSYNLRSRPNAPHSTLVDFYVYVHGDQPVDDVYLLFSHEEPILLRRVGSDIRLWHYQLPLRCDLKKEYVEYFYRILIKGHDSTVPVFGRWLSKDATFMDEISERNIKSNKQYDVFHFSQDRRYYQETVPQSVIFYIKWLLHSVDMSNISQILQQVEEMRFDFTAKHVRDFIAWIVEQVIGPSVTDIQRLYLCLILGLLFQNCSRHFRFPNDSNSKQACDRLLECFSARVHSSFLSPSNLKILEKLANTLVQNCSCPGWLNLAATFYPYLGVRYVLQKKHDSGLKYKYDIKEYHKLMDTLLKNIDNTEQEENEHQSLLQAVLEIAPSNDVVVQLFDGPDTGRFFADEAGKEDFFVKFYQDSHHSGRRRGVGEKVVELLKIPQKLREKLYRLVNSCLLDFVSSDEEVKEEHIKAFIDLIILHNSLQQSQVVDLLIEISRSKSVRRHGLLLRILHTSCFRADWHNTAMAHKVKICSTWVNTKVVNETRMNSGVDKTTAVYHGIEELMRCSLNKSNNKLAEEVSKTVVENILRNEESLSILKAFVKIDKYSTVVQDCYKTHVKEILGRDRRLMRKSVKILEEYSSSR